MFILAHVLITLPAYPVDLCAGQRLVGRAPNRAHKKFIAVTSRCSKHEGLQSLVKHFGYKMNTMNVPAKQMRTVRSQVRKKNGPHCSLLNALQLSGPCY